VKLEEDEQPVRRVCVMRGSGAWRGPVEGYSR